MTPTSPVSEPHRLSAPRVANELNRMCRSWPVLGLSVVFALGGGGAGAVDECGPATGSRTVVCDDGNYDPSQGNVFYQLPENTRKTDYVFELADGLRIAGTRGRPQVTVDEQTDDHGRRWNLPDDNWAYYGAFWVDTGPDFDGDITVRSSADLTADGPAEQATTGPRGISVRQQGTSGDINVYMTGGSIRSVGSGIWAAIDSRYDGDNDRYPDEFRDEDYDGDILIDLSGGTVETTGHGGVGVRADNSGSGNVRIVARAETLDAVNPDVETSGTQAEGLLAVLGNSYNSADARPGDIDIVVENFHILTRGDATVPWGGSMGVRADHINAGELNIDISGSRIETRGSLASGVYAAYFNRGSQNGGPLSIDISDTAIETRGEHAEGVLAWHESAGDIDVNLERSSVKTAGETAIGIDLIGQGDIDIDLTDTGIETTDGDALRLIANGDSRIGVSVTRGGIAAKGDGQWDTAIYAHHWGDGDIDIDLTEVDVDVGSSDGNGVYIGRSRGLVEIDMAGGSIDVESAAGIEVTNTGDAARSGIDVSLTRGASVTAGGHGMALGGAGRDDDGYAKQTVSVDGRVRGGSGDAAGLYFGGGGKVSVGPRGSVGADSGIAVHAAGGAGGMDRKLLVDVDLDGRRWARAVRGDVRNDNGIETDGALIDPGRTAIVVNGVTLHDGERRSNLAVANGARDISLHAGAEGPNFSAADFLEIYAARSAVYEALPGFLLRLERAAPSLSGREPGGAPGPLVWGRLSGSTGSYGANRSVAGAEYDFDRYEAEAGTDISLDDEITGTASVRHVRGSADVASPTGAGEIEVDGFGVALAAAWRGADGAYGLARASLTRYDVDLSADPPAASSRGAIDADTRASTLSLRAEAGRRVAVGPETALTPRAWLVRSDVSVERFADAVDSRVSLTDGERRGGGVGLAAETVRVLRGGPGGERSLSVRGSVDLEHWFDATTEVVVSGERLRSEGKRTRVLLGLGGVLGWNGGELRAGI